MTSIRKRLGHALAEVSELGVRGTLFRLGWELSQRSGLQTLARIPRVPSQLRLNTDGMPFERPDAVRLLVAPHISPEARSQLVTDAGLATAGTIRCFSKWTAHFGPPAQWHRDPTTGHDWPRQEHWSRALRHAAPNVDIKVIWEPARFPHAYWLARASLWNHEEGSRYAAALGSQISEFRAANPWPRGPHWASSQEVAFRLLAWLFGAHVFGLGGEDSDLARCVSASLFEGAHHVEQNLAYAKHAVHNNHLLSEALLLVIAGCLLEGAGESPRRWLAAGVATLLEQADRQFYADGGYIQLSHNYHRLAVQVLLIAYAFLRKRGTIPTGRLLAALERSTAFLTAHQNPVDGSLPNYGNNDGGLPAILSTCDFSDFRPTLQAAALVTRRRRLYAPGPWDEESAWLFGVDALAVGLDPPRVRSCSFPVSGFHVLRGKRAETFATFRCGTIRDRFTQMDMLHVDVYWRGLNLVIDGGSYLYNGPAVWHAHFQRTGIHNTVMVDDLDQMVHHRKFKMLYPTQARTLSMVTGSGVTRVTGEHFAYARTIPDCIHRRHIETDNEETWAVIDEVSGSGRHRLRIHWLLAAHPFVHDGHRLRLSSPAGVFSVACFTDRADPLTSTVVAGDDAAPRGWTSRYYGERTATPSFAVEFDAHLPCRVITVLGAGDPMLMKSSEGLRVVNGDASWTIDPSAPAS